MGELDSFNKDSVDYSDKNYNYLYFLIQHINGNSIQVKGNYYGHEIDTQQFVNSNRNKKCRYCRSTIPIVSFHKKEHIFPESIGNKAFITDGIECDECNQLFSKYENDLCVF